MHYTLDGLMRVLKVCTNGSLCRMIMKAYLDILVLKKHTISNNVKPLIIIYHHNLSTECAIKHAKNDTAAKDIVL